MKKIKLKSPACTKNQAFILEVLKEHIAPKAKILEVASGSGEHAAYFTTHMHGWCWQPSDINGDAIQSIQSYRDESNQNNFLEPLKLSTRDKEWSIGQFDAAFCCNMIHISPWESSVGLFNHMARHLLPGGAFIIYGPFFQNNIETAPSNLKFDNQLRTMNSAFGIRNLADITNLAHHYGFSQIAIHKMPANNLTVIFRKNNR